MNKKNQGIEVKLSVMAISAILVASLFVMGSSRFIPDAMAQNFTDLGAAAGGAANQTGAAAGGAANQTGAAATGAANQTGAAATEGGGAANQTGAMIMIPQAAMTTIMDDITTVRGAVDEGDTEAVDALDNIEMQLRTAAGLPLEDTGAADEEADTGADEEADEEADTGADEEETTTTDEEETTTTDEEETTTTDEE
jgi:hypothetical protein